MISEVTKAFNDFETGPEALENLARKLQELSVSETKEERPETAEGHSMEPAEDGSPDCKEYPTVTWQWKYLTEEDKEAEERTGSLGHDMNELERGMRMIDIKKGSEKGNGRSET